MSYTERIKALKEITPGRPSGGRGGAVERPRPGYGEIFAKAGADILRQGVGSVLQAGLQEEGFLERAMTPESVLATRAARKEAESRKAQTEARYAEPKALSEIFYKTELPLIKEGEATGRRRMAEQGANFRKLLETMNKREERVFKLQLKMLKKSRGRRGTGPGKNYDKKRHYRVTVGPATYILREEQLKDVMGKVQPKARVSKAGESLASRDLGSYKTLSGWMATAEKVSDKQMKDEGWAFDSVFDLEGFDVTFAHEEATAQPDETPDPGSVAAYNALRATSETKYKREKKALDDEYFTKGRENRLIPKQGKDPSLYQRLLGKLNNRLKTDLSSAAGALPEDTQKHAMQIIHGVSGPLAASAAAEPAAEPAAKPVIGAGEGIIPILIKNWVAKTPGIEAQVSLPGSQQAIQRAIDSESTSEKDRATLKEMLSKGQ